MNEYIIIFIILFLIPVLAFLSFRFSLIYHKLPGHKTEVGIISSEDIPTQHSRRKKYNHVFREAAALVC